eukprot:s2975_g1.t1
MELRETVLERDVNEAVRLLKAATYAAAVDPETGLIDWEQLISGKSAGQRKRMQELEMLVQEAGMEFGFWLCEGKLFSEGTKSWDIEATINVSPLAW